MKQASSYEKIAASYVAPALVGALARTLRIGTVGEDHLRAGMDEHGRYIFGCLHGRMFLPVWKHRHDRITTLVSQSRDGELVARLVEALGHRTVRGSSHRGGMAGLRKMVEAGRDGPLGMMVDGPRGPREDPKPGTIALARMTGLAIVPLAGVAVRAWEFNSWDRFQLPRPLSRAWVLYGEPLRVPRSAKGEDALEEYRLELQRRLIALRELGDRVARGEERP